MSDQLGCEDCGMLYSSDAWCDACIPDVAWKVISTNHDEGGILCFKCMSDRLVAAGLSNVPVYIGSGPMRQPNIDEAFDRGWHCGFKAKQNQIDQQEQSLDGKQCNDT